MSKKKLEYQESYDLIGNSTIVINFVVYLKFFFAEFIIQILKGTQFPDN